MLFIIEKTMLMKKRIGTERKLLKALHEFTTRYPPDENLKDKIGSVERDLKQKIAKRIVKQK